jgi:hypothetical protein
MKTNNDGAETIHDDDFAAGRNYFGLKKLLTDRTYTTDRTCGTAVCRTEEATDGVPLRKNRNYELLIDRHY